MLHHQRHPQLRVEAIVNAGRQNADDGIWFTAHADVLADDVAVFREGQKRELTLTVSERPRLPTDLVD